MPFSSVSLKQECTANTCLHTRTQPPGLRLSSPPPLWEGSCCLAVLLALTGFCSRPDSESIWQVPLSTQLLPTPGWPEACVNALCSQYDWASCVFHRMLFLDPRANQLMEGETHTTNYTSTIGIILKDQTIPLLKVTRNTPRRWSVTEIK